MENRGGQVESSIMEFLPSYPLGAGLGRWGMMNVYFGDQNNKDSKHLGVEIQIPAWIVDGGIILLMLYLGALFVTLQHQARLTFHHTDGRVRLLSGIVLAGNAGLVALCFSYPVFLSPVGMQFWFLSGALQAIAVKRPDKTVFRRSIRRKLPTTESALSSPAVG